MIKRPYDYGTHECLDRTYLCMELFSYVSEHPQVEENPEWKAQADRIHSEMWKLYQDIANSDDGEPVDPRRAVIQQVQDILSAIVKLGR